MPRHRCLPIVLAAVTALALGACGDDDDGSEEEATQPLPEASEEGALEVEMVDAEGTDVGMVTLTSVEGGTRVEAEIDGLEPGFHGFHVHDVGVCDPEAPDGPFTTATGHLVGEGEAHGDHDGDMPSLYADTGGRASLATTTDAFTIEELTTGDGTAVMIHAGPDNFANIPDRYTSSEAAAPGPDQMTGSTGDAGGRAACGVVGGGA